MGAAGAALRSDCTGDSGQMLDAGCALVLTGGLHLCAADAHRSKLWSL